MRKCRVLVRSVQNCTFRTTPFNIAALFMVSMVALPDPLFAMRPHLLTAILPIRWLRGSFQPLRPRACSQGATYSCPSAVWMKTISQSHTTMSITVIGYSMRDITAFVVRMPN